jgi:hypothetical protein
VSQRGGDRSERASALLLLVAVAAASVWSRADVASATIALDQREQEVLQLEAALQQVGRDGRPLALAELEAVLVGGPAALPAAPGGGSGR